MKKARNGSDPTVFKEKNTEFLQNLQNCRSNTLRHKVMSDELSRKTESPKRPEDAEDDDEEDEEEEVETEAVAHEHFVRQLEQDFGPPSGTDDDPHFLNGTLRNFNFDTVKDKRQRIVGARGTFLCRSC